MSTSSSIAETCNGLRMCSVCKIRDDKDVTAVNWCPNCDEKLCNRCTSYHQVNRFTSFHNLKRIEEAENEMIAKTLNTENKCEKHGNMQIDSFCIYHQKLCCRKCLIDLHPKCLNIETLDFLSETYLTKERTSMSKDSFSKVAGSIEEILTEKENSLSEMDSQKLTLFSKLSNSVERAKKRLDDRCDEFMEQAEEKLKSARDTHEDNLKCLQDFKNIVKNTDKILKALEHIPPKLAFVVYWKLQEQLNLAYKTVLKVLMDDQSLIFDFEPDRRVEKITNELDRISLLLSEKPLKNWVKLSSIETGVKSLHFEIPVNFCRLIQNTITRNKCLLFAILVGVIALFGGKAFVNTHGNPNDENELHPIIRLVKTVTTNDLNIGNVDLTYAIFLNNGSILGADHSSSRLVMLDEAFRLRRELNVEGIPSGICLSSDGTEVYIVSDKKHVLAYPLYGEWKVLWRFKTKPGAWSISVINDYVVIESLGAITMYDHFGNHIWGRHGSFDCTCATYDVSNYKMHITWGFVNGICHFEIGLNWIEITYTDHDLTPGDIFFNKFDGKYFVQSQKGYVRQTGTDMSQLQVWTKNKDEKEIQPRNIALHPYKSMFLITFYDGTSKVLEVYEYS